MGFTASMTRQAAESAVGGSYSRLIAMEISMRICMMQALVTEGVNPTIAEKKRRTGAPINSASHLLCRQSR